MPVLLRDREIFTDWVIVDLEEKIQAPGEYKVYKIKIVTVSHTGRQLMKVLRVALETYLPS